MAKRASNYKASAVEFGKRLTALYKLKIFPRMGKEFAEELYKSGVEAGACIRALSSIGDAQSKVHVATDAMVALNKTAFATQVMVEGGYYTADQTAALNAYIEKLIEALSGLINSVKARQANGEARPKAQRRVVIQQTPVVKRKVVVHSSGDMPELRDDGGEQTTIPLDNQEVVSGGDGDPDGFSAPYNK